MMGVRNEGGTDDCWRISSAEIVVADGGSEIAEWRPDDAADERRLSERPRSLLRDLRTVRLSRGVGRGISPRGDPGDRLVSDRDNEPPCSRSDGNARGDGLPPERASRRGVGVAVAFSRLFASRAFATEGSSADNSLNCFE